MVIEILFDYWLYPIILPTLALLIIIALGKIKEDKAILGSVSSIFLLVTLIFEFKAYQYAVLSSVIHTFTIKSEYFASYLVFDPLSLLIAIIFTFVGFAVSIYSIGYMKEDRILEYYLLLLLMIIGLNGVAVAGDFVTLYLFYELLGITAYLLVAFLRNWEAIEASIKYLIMGVAGAACILIGMGILYGIFGTFNFQLARELITRVHLNTALYIALAFLVVGFGVKAALFPMHVWLPDAHPAAPSGISAMLSGVVIKAGMFALVKTLITYYYGIDASVLAWSDNIVVVFFILSVLTITIPNIIALVQKDIKRMLAYSSIFNMGIVFAGITVGTSFAMSAAILHVLSHALAKALLFMGSGAFIESIHTRDLDEYRGIGYSMPYTGVMFTVGTLSLAAFPPMIGFWSKFLIIVASIEAFQQGIIIGLWVAIIIAINSIISVGYYFVVLVKTIWLYPRSEISKKAKEAKEASFTVLLGQFIVFIILIITSIFFFEVFDAIIISVEKFLAFYT